MAPEVDGGLKRWGMPEIRIASNYIHPSCAFCGDHFKDSDVCIVPLRSIQTQPIESGYALLICIDCAFRLDRDLGKILDRYAESKLMELRGWHWDAKRGRWMQ